jgi:hypothetical protein
LSAPFDAGLRLSIARYSRAIFAAQRRRDQGFAAFGRDRRRRIRALTRLRLRRWRRQRRPAEQPGALAGLVKTESRKAETQSPKELSGLLRSIDGDGGIAEGVIAIAG